MPNGVREETNIALNLDVNTERVDHHSEHTNRSYPPYPCVDVLVVLTVRWSSRVGLRGHVMLSEFLAEERPVPRRILEGRTLGMASSSSPSCTRCFDIC